MEVMGIFQTAQTGDWTDLTVSIGLKSFMKPIRDVSLAGDMVIQSENLGTQKKAPTLLEE